MIITCLFIGELAGAIQPSKNPIFNDVNKRINQHLIYVKAFSNEGKLWKIDFYSDGINITDITSSIVPGRITGLSALPDGKYAYTGELESEDDIVSKKGHYYGGCRT